MAKKITIRQVMRELNIGAQTIVDFLQEKGIEIDRPRPSTPISEQAYSVLLDEFQSDKNIKEKSAEISEEQKKEKEKIRLEKEHEDDLHKKKREDEISGKIKLEGPKVIGKIDTTPEPIKDPVETPPPVKKEMPVVAGDKKPENKISEDKKEIESDKKEISEQKKEKPEKQKLEKPESEIKQQEIETKYRKLKGVKTTGEKIDLKQFEKKTKKKEEKKSDKSDKENKKKKKRKRIYNSDNKPTRGGGDNKRRDRRKPVPKAEISDEEIQKQIKETLERLQGSGKSKRSKIKREGRQKRKEQAKQDQLDQEKESKILKVTEFVTVAEIAGMMEVPVTEVITACFGLGLMVTMNQRLDAETLSLVADEFDYDVKFVDAEEEDEEEIPDNPEDLLKRTPIITIMGHVDHGKTSLLDYIREANVVAGEAGGITQHIGAYQVTLKNGEKLTFLDTPGHEAFTAMRARGTQVTDIAVIVIAADDDVMPQTKEAISHAQAAGVPIIFALNKMDKPNANPDNIKQQLANMNLLVEDWGGKYQSQEISAKTGQNIDDLLEKILLEAEMLELKANPNRPANGTVIEASLDKGRGYVANLLVQNGTMKMGNYILVGKHHGRIKAMFDERENKVKEVGPSTPISILGLDGAPSAGDTFRVYEDEREAKRIAQKRDQLIREQQLRAQKHITLDEIGRRIALGDFKELNLIIKGDVDGSVEALSDSLQKLSTENVSVVIIHKGVGQISDSDVLLASASDAIIIGFNVRPSVSARRLSEQEEVQIKTYSIIYDVINDVKEAMEGMLSMEIKEEVTGNVEVRETFKISKVGTVAGCMVTSGKIFNNSKIRLIREGIVIYDGELASLKRFKDDVKEVAKGYECGLMIKNYNNLEIGDTIEAYKNYEVKRKL